MSQLNHTASDKSSQRQLSIRRAQFLKKLKIKVKSAKKILDEDHLIIIQTFNTQKNKSVELVMRRLSQLDTLVAHMNNVYGGHVIPVFTHDLYYQSQILMNVLVPDIEEYLNDLKHNKYCRQDIKFYCFMIQQNASFPKEMGFERMITVATDKSRRYLNELFTRKQMPSLKETGQLLAANEQLINIIGNYNQLKNLCIIKVKQTIIFQQISNLFAEMSARPGMGVYPQDIQTQYIGRTIKSCQKLIQQAQKAIQRWEKLAENVRELQNNVYKGLHQFQGQFNQNYNQLKQWTQSLRQQFTQLGDYLTEKTEGLACSIYKINKNFIQQTVFTGKALTSSVSQEEKNGNTHDNIKKDNKQDENQRKESKGVEAEIEKQQEEQKIYRNDYIKEQETFKKQQVQPQEIKN